MESFSLLKYWRGGGGAALAAAAATAASSIHSTAAAATTTIATSVDLDPSAETDDDGGDVSDDGPFFDLEFAVPEEDDDEEEKDGSAAAMEAESDDNEEREFNFMVSSEESCGGDLRSDPLSPSDDLFFKGKLVPLEPSSIVITSSEADPRPQFAVSLLKSATKFRVFMLGLRKAKSTPAEPKGAPASPTTAAAAASPKQPSQPQQSKFFIKFKVEEVPIISLFTRDNGSRNSSGSKAVKPQVEESAAAPSSAAVEDSTATPSSAAAEEKKFSKEVVQKYLNKIKPLYVRVSKRYAQKLRFSGQLTPGAAATKAGPSEGEETDVEAEAAAAPPAATGTASGVKCQKVNVPTGLKVVCKRLGKSRSASAAVAAVPSPPPPPPQRRDDSLLQQQDGIQSAIAHCKKSFNAATGSESSLVRSKSDPCAAVAAVPSPPPPPQRRDDSLLQQQDGIQSAIAHCKKSFNAAKGNDR
ncbi:putative membrane-associated kinase regulator 2 [Cocos nucifera]|uniref:Putative membrane-associated kinase regulator 2 n=1 Tax=Cocos nucifera TaxID=13894 RepID=A0A8K0MW26_COCNU|nr:putative membrane-associated kinase regulator 2 [Cocos nucifera]